MVAATLSDLSKALEAVALADPKARRKLARGLGHMAMQLERIGGLAR